MYTLLKVLIISIIFTGCSNLLPELKKESVSNWKSYGDIESVYKEIIPYETTKDKLHQLGFNPYKASNVKVLNYLNIMEIFLINPSIKLSDLDPSLNKCLSKKKSCIGYELYIETVNKKRYGNVFSDLFNFRKKTKISGWNFYALIVLDEESVVYKIYNGNPSILEKEDKNNPLGPFQSMESIFRHHVD